MLRARCPGPALAVALHVALDPAARRAVDRLNAVGGALMEGEAGETLDDAALQRVMARLDQVAVEPRAKSPARRLGFEWAPPPLVPYLRPGMSWRSILGKFDEIRLDVPGDAYRVSLLRLEPGRACRSTSIPATNTRSAYREVIPTRPAATAWATSPSARAASGTSRSPIQANPASR